MGIYVSCQNNDNYYNKINKKSWVSSNQKEILRMEKMFRNHLNDYVVDARFMPNDEIKIVLYLSDFYNLLGSKYHKSFMQVYERRLFGLTNPRASESHVKSDREMSKYLYNIINDELLTIIENYQCLKKMIYNNFFAKINKVKKKEKQTQKLDI